MLDVDATSFLVIVTAATAAGAISMALAPKLAIPVVVLELVAGILIGPEVFDLATIDDFTEFFSNLGLGMLFFFAGYEIDFRRVVGTPLAAGRARLGRSRSRSPTRSAECWRAPASCCRSSTPARRSRRRRSAR